MPAHCVHVVGWAGLLSAAPVTCCFSWEEGHGACWLAMWLPGPASLGTLRPSTPNWASKGRNKRGECQYSLHLNPAPKSCALGKCSACQPIQANVHHTCQPTQDLCMEWSYVHLHDTHVLWPFQPWHTLWKVPLGCVERHASCLPFLGGRGVCHMVLGAFFNLAAFGTSWLLSGVVGNHPAWFQKL